MIDLDAPIIRRTYDLEGANMPITPSTVPPTPKAAHTPDNLVGGVWALVAVVAATIMTIGVREAAVGVDTRMVVLLRSLMILAVMTALLPLPWVRARLRFSRPGLHLLRGALMGLSIQLGFHAIVEIPLATATVLFFTAPIFATIFAVPINGERIGPRRIAAVTVGFLGALIVLRPGVDTINMAMVGGLGSSLLFALALALSRGVAAADGAFSAFYSSIVISVLISIPIAIPVWSMPSGADLWWAIGLTAAAGTMRGVADLESYRRGEASVMGVVSYLRLVALGLVGWLMFDESPDPLTWVGGAVIIGSTLYIAHRERSQRRAARAQAAAA
ncbi:MAG: drug/metabolite transporter (DMT)-like permease [Paracoccaceae bacterium]|jgi:drug/metabolite transporter (DMT)-like permease